MCLVVFVQPYAPIKGNKKVIPNAEWRNWKKKQWKKRHGSNCINTLTLWPWEHDWDCNNLPYIVRFGHYCPHGFVPSDASPPLSLTPQNVYDKLATSTLNKTSYHSLTRRCEILQSTSLRSPMTMSVQPDS